jgi:glycosyltransferase involved in cell wall biosynthesis
MTLDQSLRDLVSIGITTKNRWQDLWKTLCHIQKFGLWEIPILIVDDGSDEACPLNLSELSLNIYLTRFSSSKGLIARRNQLAQMMQTKYYLSFDDDSYPVAGSLEAAVEFAEAQNNLLGLSFPIYNPTMQVYQNASCQSGTYQVRSFVGCGHLLHIPHFLQLGGYREELIHQGEEMEITARAFQKGFYCYHFPKFEIHHTESTVSRNWQRMDYYGARNNVLWNDWFTPPSRKFIQQFRTLSSRSLLALKVRRNGQFKGEMAGFRDITQYTAYRQPMSLEQFKAWKALPHS